ncbi:MAG: malate synthase G, partial [Pseudomonadales bacterium]
MTHYVKQGGLQIAKELHTFIVSDVLPELEIDAAAYWSNLESLLTQFAPKNRSLLAKRDAFQLELDNYHRSMSGRALDQSEYERFLRRIGYLEADVEPFEIETTGVDDEIASIAGPQLVVPIMNAR